MTLRIFEGHAQLGKRGWVAGRLDEHVKSASHCGLRNGIRRSWAVVGRKKTRSP